MSFAALLKADPIPFAKSVVLLEIAFPVEVALSEVDFIPRESTFPPLSAVAFALFATDLLASAVVLLVDFVCLATDFPTFSTAFVADLATDCVPLTPLETVSFAF